MRARGTGSLIKINGCDFWYAQFYKDGKQHRVSTRETVKEKAKFKLQELVNDAEKGIVTETQLRKIRYADIRELLLHTYREKERRSLQTLSDGSETVWGLPALDQFMGLSATNRGPALPKIEANLRDRFVAKRKKEGVSPSTINGSLRLLRHMLTLQFRKLKITMSPYIELLPEAPPREGFLEISDFENLLAALPVRLRPLVILLFYTGARKEEALSIDWSQVDLEYHLIEIKASQAKNARARHIPIPAPIYDELVKTEKKRGPVFDGEGLRREWEKACAAVGLGVREKRKGRFDYRYHGLMIHDLRRSAVRNLRRSGVSEETAMKISGHLTREIFRRYNIIDPSEEVAAMREVEKRHLQTLGENSVKSMDPPIKELPSSRL